MLTKKKRNSTEMTTKKKNCNSSLSKAAFHIHARFFKMRFSQLNRAALGVQGNVLITSLFGDSE